MTTETTRRVVGLTGVASTGRLSLADAIKGSKNLPSRVVFHGHGGIGKTTFAAHTPNPFFLLSPGETGLHSLIDAGLIPEVPNIEVAAWDDAQGVIGDLTTQEHPYRTLVIDAIDGIEKLCNKHVCVTDYGGTWGEKGFMGFHRGYKTAASGPWRELLSSLDRLRETKKMGIMLLAHTGTGAFQNPTGPDFNRYLPDMYKDAWQLTFGWADMVLFADREVVVAEEKGKAKGKARNSLPRTIHTEWTPFADAKNRHNLPEEIEMGESGQEAWTNFTTAIKESRKENANG